MGLRLLGSGIQSPPISAMGIRKCRGDPENSFWDSYFVETVRNHQISNLFSLQSIPVQLDAVPRIEGFNPFKSRWSDGLSICSAEAAPKVKVAAVVEAKWTKPVLGRWSTKSQPMRILESTLGEGWLIGVACQKEFAAFCESLAPPN